MPAASVTARRASAAQPELAGTHGAVGRHGVDLDARQGRAAGRTRLRLEPPAAREQDRRHRRRRRTQTSKGLVTDGGVPRRADREPVARRGTDPREDEAPRCVRPVRVAITASPPGGGGCVVSGRSSTVAPRRASERGPSTRPSTVRPRSANHPLSRTSPRAGTSTRGAAGSKKCASSTRRAS